MDIAYYYTPITNSVNLISDLLIDIYLIDADIAVNIATRSEKYFSNLRDTCYLVAETQYVDRVYRDSYYHYYSSKNKTYERNCIKISIFEGEVSDDDFKSEESVKNLRIRFRGFIILRPTFPNIIGRSLISPECLKVNSFLSCFSKTNTTVRGVKFEVKGFPHSSQDEETMTCAETTIWALMEYFSNKYHEYKSVLPFKILKVLENVSFERQIPSKGLIVDQISFALRDFGFGTRIYSRESHLVDFENLLSCYIASGIPLIVEIDNANHPSVIDQEKEEIVHAVVCIGYEVVTPEDIKILATSEVEDVEIDELIKSKNIKFYDWHSIKKKFVFIDDNLPSYSLAPLEKPAIHYDSDWDECKINHFIAPLYPKIYLEVFEAKNYIIETIFSLFEIEVNSEVFLKIYLTSSRSYKNELSLNVTFQKDLKDKIMLMPMPKFIWVAEIGTKAQFEENKAHGLIILDSTEENIYYDQPILFAAYNNKYYIHNNKSKLLGKFNVSLQPFLMYNNLGSN